MPNIANLIVTLRFLRHASLLSYRIVGGLSVRDSLDGLVRWDVQHGRYGGAV